MKYLILICVISSSFFQVGNLEKLVEDIAKDGTLGFDLDDQYKRMMSINSMAELEHLVTLTDHRSPAVRGYAFWALAKRHYTDLQSIFIAHIDDKEKVLQKNGCMVGEESVISFMKQVVTPYMYDKSCKKLSRSVRDRVLIN